MGVYKVVYFSGSTRQFFNFPDLFGCMFNTAQPCGKQWEALNMGCKFMLDNGIFSNLWQEREWLMSLYDFLPFRDNCYGVILPDFLYYLKDGTVKGDWQKTLERFYKYYTVVRCLRFPVALASQDGLVVEEVPWQMIDTLFIGGSDSHKRGKEAELLALEARRRGKWIHVGRASSVSSIHKFWGWADSWDGTTFRFAPDEKEERLVPQLRRITKEKNKTWQLKMF